jgi:hypothetical protein
VYGASVEDAREVPPEQGRAEEDEPDEGGELEPVLPAHPTFSGASARVNEVREHRDRERQPNSVVDAHCSLPSWAGEPPPRMSSQARMQATATAKKPMTTAMR